MSWRSLLSYGTWRRPLTGCSVLSVRKLSSIECIRCGRPMTQYIIWGLLCIVWRRIGGPWKAIALLYSQPLCSAQTRWNSCQGKPPGLGRRWPGECGGRCLPQRKTEKGEGGSHQWGMNICWGWLVGPIPPLRPRREKDRGEGGLIGGHWNTIFALCKATKARNLVRKNVVDLDRVWPTGKVRFYPIKHISIDTERFQFA